MLCLQAKEAGLDGVEGDGGDLAKYLINKVDAEEAAEREKRTGIKASSSNGGALAKGGKEGDADAEDSDAEEAAAASRSLIPAGYRTWGEVAAAMASPAPHQKAGIRQIYLAYCLCRS